MNNHVQVQTCWTAFAALTRQATQILKDWRKYRRQADQLNELQQRARSACARGNYPQVAGEPHWAIVRRINGLRSEQAAICQRAAAVLLDLEDVLPLDKIEALEREISPTSVRRSCQGILMAAKHLNEHCAPAPAGWPESSDGDTNVLLEDSVINKLATQVKEMETEIDAAEQKRVELPALLKQICKKKKIKLEGWLEDNDIDRSAFYVWKHAGGKPVEGKVSVDMADKIKTAILQEAMEPGLLSTYR